MVGRMHRREEGVLRLAFGAFLVLDRPQHTPQPLHSMEPSGGSTARGKGEGGADGRGVGTGHCVLSTDPHMNRIMIESYVCLSMRAGHVEDELMEQEGVAEEGKVPLLGVVPPPREVSMSMCNVGLQHAGWMEHG
jgi:hypothetical protein